MANANDFKDMARKYQAGKKSGTSKKQVGKVSKKALENALKQAMKLSRDNQIAAIKHEGHTYIMMKQEVLQESINNFQQGLGFQPNPSKEMLEFSKYHQEVLTVMSKLNYEELARDMFDSDEDYQEHLRIVKRNSDLFNEIDSWTFEFSQGMMEGEAYRKKTRDEYLEFRKQHPEIDEILESKVEPTIG